MKRTPLARRTPLRGGKVLARGAAIARGKGIRKRNPKRQASNWKRSYHSKARQKFVTQLPCAACGYEGIRPRHNAHIPDPSSGASRKADYTAIIPLCGACHLKQHGVNGGWLAIAMPEESRRRAAELTELAWLSQAEYRSGDSTDD